MASEHFYETYRDLPYAVEPIGINLHLANVDPIKTGLVVKKGLIELPNQARHLDFFEVIAAGPGYKSAFSGQFVENPCAVGDIVLIEQTNVSISFDGEKRIALCGADKVLGKVKPKAPAAAEEQAA